MTILRSELDLPELHLIIPFAWGPPSSTLPPSWAVSSAVGVSHTLALWSVLCTMLHTSPHASSPCCSLLKGGLVVLIGHHSSPPAYVSHISVLRRCCNTAFPGPAGLFIGPDIQRRGRRVLCIVCVCVCVCVGVCRCLGHLHRRSRRVGYGTTQYAVRVRRWRPFVYNKCKHTSSCSRPSARVDRSRPPPRRHGPLAVVFWGERVQA